MIELRLMLQSQPPKNYCCSNEVTEDRDVEVRMRVASVEGLCFITKFIRLVLIR